MVQQFFDPEHIPFPHDAYADGPLHPARDGGIFGGNDYGAGGGSYGAGNYGMCGRGFAPRFLFAWPSAKSAVMGGAQLAGVISIVSRAAAEARGQAFDEEADAGLRAMQEETPPTSTLKALR